MGIVIVVTGGIVHGEEDCGCGWSIDPISPDSPDDRSDSDGNTGPSPFEDSATTALANGAGDSSYDVTLILQRASSLVKQGAFEDALTLYDEATRTDPNLFAPWIGKGRALLGLGKYHDAVRAFSQASQIDASDAEPWALSGDALLASGELDAALAAYDRALMINPGLKSVLSNRSLALSTVNGGLSTRVPTPLILGGGLETATPLVPSTTDLMTQTTVPEAETDRPPQATTWNWVIITGSIVLGIAIWRRDSSA
jgi:tetratricopeptide (TPR) repeat protein